MTDQVTHPEWQEENALTAPSDRNPDHSYIKKLKQGTPPLTNEQAESAMESLNNTGFVEKFPRVERFYADPPIFNQQVGLVSFVPAKGATPNDKGVYGFMKLRGNYATEVEANGRAEEIIRNVDSYHQIYHTYVGRPFPLTLSSDYSRETSEIDIRKSMTESVSEDIKQKRQTEKHEIQEMEDRQKELLADTTERKEEDPYDTYVTNRVKEAHLKFTYIETQKKMEEMKQSILKARALRAKLDTEHPEFKDTYFQTYMDARKKAGFKDEKANAENFIRFLVDDYDAELEFLSEVDQQTPTQDLIVATGKLGFVDN